MEHQVIGLDIDVNHATRILPKDGIMGQHRPLGTGLGATRVHNLRQVATPVLRRWQGVLACTQRLEVGHALRTVRRVL